MSAPTVVPTLVFFGTKQTVKQYACGDGNKAGTLTVFSARPDNRGVQTKTSNLVAGSGQAKGINEKWAFDRVVGFHTGSVTDTMISVNDALETMKRGWHALLDNVNQYAKANELASITLAMPYADLNTMTYYGGAFLNQLPGKTVQGRRGSMRRLNAEFATYLEEQELGKKIQIQVPRPQFQMGGPASEGGLFAPGVAQIKIATFFGSDLRNPDLRAKGGGKASKSTQKLLSATPGQVKGWLPKHELTAFQEFTFAIANTKLRRAVRSDADTFNDARDAFFAHVRPMVQSIDSKYGDPEKMDQMINWMLIWNEDCLKLFAKFWKKPVKMKAGSSFTDVTAYKP
jgi:hypothetical protein